MEQRPDRVRCLQKPVSAARRLPASERGIASPLPATSVWPEEAEALARCHDLRLARFRASPRPRRKRSTSFSARLVSTSPAREHDEIVSVAYHPPAGDRHQPVEWMQVEVGKQRRDGRALRHAAAAPAERPEPSQHQSAGCARRRSRWRGRSSAGDARSYRSISRCRHRASTPALRANARSTAAMACGVPRPTR